MIDPMANRSALPAPAWVTGRPDTWATTMAEIASPKFGTAFHQCKAMGSSAAMDQPTDPSSEIATSAWASIANSIGNACNTSLQNPLTTSATASSSSMPRDRQ